MLKVVEQSQIRRLEEAVAKELNISMLDLMERAGAAVAKEAAEVMRKNALKRVVVLCGKGGNGGDGLVAARYLREEGYSVVVHLVDGQPIGDAAVMLERYDGRIVSFSPPDAGDLVIDAVFGAGFVGSVSGELERVIQAVNTSATLVLSVDLPSGQNADTFYPSGTVMRSDLTVTFFLPKPALLRYASKQIKIALLGASEAVLDAFSMPFLQPCDLQAVFPKRPRDSHKGTFGHILIVGGAYGLGGAVAMAAAAAMRSGCGRVSVYVPKENAKTVAAKLIPEVMMVRSLKSCDFSSFSAIVCGPGLGTHLRLLKEVLKKAQCPVLLDADALNLLAKNPQLWAEIKQPLLLTPHPGEMSRLVHKSTEQVQLSRIQTAKTFAAEHQAVVVLKGAHTVIADETGRIAHNPTGNPGMATAGAGDVLSGIIGALLGRGLDLWDAACLGTFIHGLAGDFAAIKLGEEALIATDIIGMIGRAITELRGDIR